MDRITAESNEPSHKRMRQSWQMMKPNTIVRDPSSGEKRGAVCGGDGGDDGGGVVVGGRAVKTGRPCAASLGADSKGGREGSEKLFLCALPTTWPDASEFIAAAAAAAATVLAAWEVWNLGFSCSSRRRLAVAVHGIESSRFRGFSEG